MTADLDLTFIRQLTDGAIWTGIAWPGEERVYWQWVPARWWHLEAGLETTDRLLAAGWEQIGQWPTNTDIAAVRLLSQLADIRMVTPKGSAPLQPEGDVWARSADVAHAKAAPVTLAFLAPDATGPVEHVREVIPPAQFGEIGILETRRAGEATMMHYEAEALGGHVLALRQRLGEALQGIAQPEMRLIASANPQEWLVRWEEVRQMAQQLAVAYWEAHEASIAIEAPDRRRRGPRKTPAGIVSKDPPHISIRSDIFTQNIMRGLLSGDEYQQYEDRQMAEHRRELAKGKGQMTITIQPGNGEEWEHVMRSLNRLGDEVVDAFCAVLAIGIDANSVENITAPMWLNTDDVLRVCQRKQSNGSYTPEQRAATVENLRILSRAHIQATWPAPKKRGQRQPTEYRIDSALIDIFGQAVGEYKTVTGETVWERRQVKIGEWARVLPPLDKQTAVMLRTVLEYHAQRDRYAKRIGRYLTLQFRVSWNQHGGTVERKMQTLLEQAGIRLDPNTPGRTRDMIEDALARLRRDGVIGPYSVVVEATPAAEEARAMVEERGRGWWDVYAQQLWRFEPPDYAREQYRQIPTRSQANDEGE